MTTIRNVLATAVGLLCLVSVGLGAYLENADSGSVRERPPVVIPPPPPPRIPDHPIYRLVRSVQPGPPIRYRNLTIFPLITDVHGDRGIRTLDEALSHGWITISEQKDASVGELMVRNDSRHSVFLMAGEILTGGKQNRIIRQDVLIAARSGLVAVPVYCGEKDRWDQPHEAFKSGESMTESGLRALAAASESQASIWGHIDRRMADSKVRSSTRDYQQIYEDERIGRELDQCVARFRHLPDRRTVGLVAMSGRRIVGCDLFADAELLSRLWDKICRSYAVDTLGWAAPPGQRHPHEDVTTRDVRRFLDGILASGIERQHSPGAGESIRITGVINGNALSWRDEIVHAVLFPGVTSWRDNIIKKEE